MFFFFGGLNESLRLREYKEEEEEVEDVNWGQRSDLNFEWKEEFLGSVIGGFEFNGRQISTVDLVLSCGWYLTETVCLGEEGYIHVVHHACGGQSQKS